METIHRIGNRQWKYLWFFEKTPEKELPIIDSAFIPDPEYKNGS